MIERKKILAIAYACSPYKGSEAGVGWGWVRMIARNREVHVITSERYRQDIEKYKDKEDFSAGVTFHYLQHDYSRFLDRVCPPYYLATYNRWLDEAYDLAVQLCRENTFQLCHLITYVGFRHPGRFYQLDVPFVWGPVGGLDNTPWQVLPSLGFKGGTYLALRNIVNSYHKRFLSEPAKAFAAAARTGAVIAATTSVSEEIRKHYGIDSTVICEVGPPDIKTTGISKREKDEVFRICWSGHFFTGKALPILLKALADLPSEINWQLDILGDGPCGIKWKGLAHKLGIAQKCQWYGRVERDEAMSTMSKSHVFVITSLKELTSSVLLEALSLGIPVICPDLCGFRDVVDDTCGTRIPVGSFLEMTAKLGRAVESLVHDEARRRKLSEGAVARAGRYTWDGKREALENIYRSITGGQ